MSNQLRDTTRALIDLAVQLDQLVERGEYEAAEKLALKAGDAVRAAWILLAEENR